MNDSTIRELLISAVRASAPSKAVKLEKANLDCTLKELGLDSIEMMEMVACIEESRGVVFPDESLARLNTLNDFVTLIQKHSNQTKSLW